MKQDRSYAVVYINGRKIFLGKWGSVEADTEYRRILAEWVSNPVSPGTKSNGLATIDEPALAFLKWAKEYHEYRTYHCFKTAIEAMLELYGGISIRDFGCRKLTTLQSLFISKGYARTQVNRFVCCIKRVFSWGVKEELVPVEIANALKHVDALRKGKTKAKENTPRTAVSDEVVERTLPFLLPTIADMIKIQRLAAMRPEEVCQMRVGDINTSGEVWMYCVPRHKLTWKEETKVVPLGLEEQEILKSRMEGKGKDDYVFSPREALQERWERDKAKRKTKITPSQLKRHEDVVANPKRKTKECYTAMSYWKSIKQSVAAANKKLEEPIPHWVPYQLRHAAISEVSSELGRDAARAYAGQKTIAITGIYDHSDIQTAIRIAKERRPKFKKNSDE